MDEHGSITFNKNINRKIIFEKLVLGFINKIRPSHNKSLMIKNNLKITMKVTNYGQTRGYWHVLNNNSTSNGQSYGEVNSE